MIYGKPVIGLAGGIGSGKSFVGRIFGEMGCLVIDSDQQARAIYEDPAVKRTLEQWWGPGIFQANGSINRSAIAGHIFGNADERQRLEHLLHPLVNESREQAMKRAVNDPKILAFVWDTPLLFETGLNRQCDKVVFVDASVNERVARVKQSRGWKAEELIKRENLQQPLDNKRKMSDYVVVNTADAENTRSQVRDILSKILANFPFA